MKWINFTALPPGHHTYVFYTCHHIWPSQHHSLLLSHSKRKPLAWGHTWIRRPGLEYSLSDSAISPKEEEIWCQWVGFPSGMGGQKGRQISIYLSETEPEILSSSVLFICHVPLRRSPGDWFLPGLEWRRKQCSQKLLMSLGLCKAALISYPSCWSWHFTFPLFPVFLFRMWNLSSL